MAGDAGDGEHPAAAVGPEKACAQGVKEGGWHRVGRGEHWGRRKEEKRETGESGAKGVAHGVVRGGGLWYCRTNPVAGDRP